MGKNNLKPFYTTPDKSISFFPNDRDGPGAYHVQVKGKSHFYVADGTLGDLADPEISISNMMVSLDAMCGHNTVRYILEENRLTPGQLQIAFRQLRVKIEKEFKDTVSLSLRH